MQATVKAHHTSKAGVKSTILTRAAVEEAAADTMKEAAWPTATTTANAPAAAEWKAGSNTTRAASRSAASVSKCRKRKLARYRPEVLTDSQYECDEQIEEDYRVTKFSRLPLYLIAELEAERERKLEEGRRVYAYVRCPPPEIPDPVCEDQVVEFTIEFN